MRASQQVHERATRTGGQKEAASGELSPSHPLSDEETHAQHDRAAQPREALSFSNRNPGNRFDRSQRHFPCNFPSRQLHSDTAQHQQQSVHQQQRGGKIHLYPVTNIGAGTFVEGRQALPHDVRAGERNEQHDDGRQVREHAVQVLGAREGGGEAELRGFEAAEHQRARDCP